jgi:hypothetical protein
MSKKLQINKTAIASLNTQDKSETSDTIQSYGCSSGETCG